MATLVNPKYVHTVPATKCLLSRGEIRLRLLKCFWTQRQGREISALPFSIAGRNKSSHPNKKQPRFNRFHSVCQRRPEQSISMCEFTSIFIKKQNPRGSQGVRAGEGPKQTGLGAETTTSPRQTKWFGREEEGNTKSLC